MRTHTILEAIRDVTALLGPHTKNTFDIKALMYSATVLAQAVTFDLQGNHPLSEHVEFGYDLAANGLLQMPFPQTMWCSSANPHQAIASISTRGRSSSTSARRPFSTGACTSCRP